MSRDASCITVHPDGRVTCRVQILEPVTPAQLQQLLAPTLWHIEQLVKGKK